MTSAEGNMRAVRILLSGGSTLRDAASALGCEKKALRFLRDRGVCGKKVAAALNESLGFDVIVPTPGAFAGSNSKPKCGSLDFGRVQDVRDWNARHPLDASHDHIVRFFKMLLRQKGFFK